MTPSCNTGGSTGMRSLELWAQPEIAEMELWPDVSDARTYLEEKGGPSAGGSAMTRTITGSGGSSDSWPPDWLSSSAERE
jgi:hypothetical protein